MAHWAQVGDRLYLAINGNNLGDAYRRIGEYGLARKHLQQALQIFEVAGREGGVFHTRHNLAGVLLDSSQVGQAEQMLQNLLNGLEPGRRRAMVLTDLAYLYLRQEEPEQARTAAEEALELWRQDGNKPNSHIAAALLAASGQVEVEIFWRDLTQNGVSGSENPPHMAWLYWYKALAECQPQSARISLRRGIEVLFEQAGQLTNMRHRHSFLGSVPLSVDLMEAWSDMVLGEAGHGRDAIWSAIQLWKLRLNGLATLFIEYVLDEIEAERYAPDAEDVDLIETIYTEVYSLE